MTQLQQSNIRNQLLRALSPEDFAALLPELRPDVMPLRQALIPPHTPIEAVHFPEEGFVSVTYDSADGRAEVGLIGREGLVGAAPILLGDDRSPHMHFVQMAGHMLTIDTEALRTLVDERPTLRRLLHRSIQAQFIQTAQTAFTNAWANTTTRLARWLLMSQDRIDGNTVFLTQEFISFMLGIERPGVTVTLQMLEKEGLVKRHRGSIEIIDRDRLLDLAGDTYGVAEAEYARLVEGRNELNA